MEIKLHTLNNSYQALKRLVAKELPAATAWKLARIGKKAEDELKILTEQHKRIFDKYAEDGEIKQKNTPAYKEEWESLLNETVELDIKPIGIKEFRSISISASDLILLSFLIEGEEEAK